ncbi:MAG: hypothetical protein AAGJ40_09740 [Planctomycetota bacterium]
MKTLLTALMIVATASFAHAGEVADFLDSIGSKAAKAPAREPAVSSRPAISSSRLDDIERRIEALERTSIDAGEAEEIAERVVQRYIKQLQVAVKTASGGQRTETVQFSGPTDTQKFSLAPGETIVSYCDVYTGETVRVGQPTTHVRSTAYSQPVPTWRTPTVVMQTQPAPVSTTRMVAVRPVVQSYSSAPVTEQVTTYRRGLFGRQVARTRTCTMVNGVKVCN